MMEIALKLTNLFVGLFLIRLCSGFPYALENSAADYHTQFITGLVGVLLTICGIVFLIGCLCCQRKNGFKEFHNSPVVASSTSSLDHGHINPIANGEFTIFTPLSPPHHNNNIFLANEQIVGHTEIDYNNTNIDVHSWFDGTESDFPRTKLKYIKELGKGWFGRVVEGTAQGLNGNNWMPVAVRILEASATSTQRAVFLHDAAIYRYGKHPHILQLLGRSLESVPLLLLQELCPYGDLKKYLKENRGSAEKILFSELPLNWCCQLSSALKHLHDHRLTHPDLATRNCQVVSDLNIKLGDYGLAASLYPEDYYQGAPAVPVRWCAPELLTYTSTTIQPKQVTFEGNIWTLGVTMWEIFECGAQPYANLNDDDVIAQVLGSSNVRLAKPSFPVIYIDYIFRLMQLCWSSTESRPSVSQIYLMLTDLRNLYQNSKHLVNSETLTLMQDFDKRWETFKPNSVARTDNQEFIHETQSLTDVHLSDITISSINFNREEELLNTKLMSPSLNNLHGSLDNLVTGEMDSWLQKVANKTGDMSYVRGLSEAIKDLDNTLALENVSSSDSSHQPSPAPENLAKVTNKLEFKLGPTENTWNDLNESQNSNLEESLQRSSESETEDENWRRKIEQGVYSEKVQQKSKSVTDLMILTHIDYSESDSETPLPSLDYRVNYRNVRYAPKQNLENLNLTFGSEGNLLSVHDKFQEELRKLQEERKDSLLFVPDYISHNEKLNNGDATNVTSEESSCKYVNNDPFMPTVLQERLNLDNHDVNNDPFMPTVLQERLNLDNHDVSPNHRNPETLLEELSSPTVIQPANQVYNIFNVTVDSKFSPLHVVSNLKNIICIDPESSSNEDLIKNHCYEVPKLKDLIENNDILMDYIISKYESSDDVNIKLNETVNISENVNKELNNNTEVLQIIKNYNTEEIVPSSLTHSVLFTSTPSKQQNMKLNCLQENEEECMKFSSNFSELCNENQSTLNYSLETWDNFLGQALETPKSCNEFEEFSNEPHSLLFLNNDSSLDSDTICNNSSETNSQNHQNKDISDLNSTVTETQQNFEINNTNLIVDEDDGSRILNKTYSKEDISNWESGEGWFLHPQATTDVSGQIKPSKTVNSESYVGFNMDDEVMVAIRNELLMKLPHAQGQASEQIKESDDWNSEEKNEMVIKYNVYAVPLSPIPEESYSDYSHHFSYNLRDSSDSDNDEWPEPYEEEHNSETHSVQNNDSPIQELLHRHTPSLDSCCSNDTLFNLEELTCGANEIESADLEKRNAKGAPCTNINGHIDNEEAVEDTENIMLQLNGSVAETVNDKVDKQENLMVDLHEDCLISFRESEHTLKCNCDDLNKVDENVSEGSTVILQELNDITSDNHNYENSAEGILVDVDLFNIEDKNFANENENDGDIKENNNKLEMYEQNITILCKNEINKSKLNDLHEVEDKKGDNFQLTIIENYGLNGEVPSNVDVNNINTNEDELLDENHENLNVLNNDINNLDIATISTKIVSNDISPINCPELVENIKNLLSSNETKMPKDISADENAESTCKSYITKFLNHERQNSINSVTTYEDNLDLSCINETQTPVYVNLESQSINDTVEYVNVTNDIQPLYVNLLEDPVESEQVNDIYDALTDIRFTGPSDIQLMSTSFSESADIDEQDWDSGSDTRSSSSGEFIWKEGEHEESVKALRAAPQDVNTMEKVTPMEEIEEVTSESSEDEEGDSPEFVPSAWDKYATPTKSALRSPEKTLEKTEIKCKKSKGVWFKKQKYHCVYEYPREPDSPNLNSYELWQPVSASIMDWEIDTGPFISDLHDDNYQNLDKHSRNLNHFGDFTSGVSLDDEFFISSTAKPFEAFGGLSSQFFPGKSLSDQWVDLTKCNENITPDSGAEDITPAATYENDEFLQISSKLQVHSLKLLAAAVLKQTQINKLKTNNKDCLGGLRHARNKLKLDLPPSPNAFTSTKIFTIEPDEEPITKREVPSFTTFGKSRFLVQHVDTPTCDEENEIKNVSFEALPYKPMQVCTKENKAKVEVRGEASLLDSTDEDSGIESSTLERKKITNIVD